MTAKEFYKTHWKTYITNSAQIYEFAQAYADHLEAAQWVTDGSLPPVDADEFSVDVLANYGFDGNVVAYMNLKNKKWYNAKSHDQITAPKAWRPLPSPPNTTK